MDVIINFLKKNHNVYIVFLFFLFLTSKLYFELLKSFFNKRVVFFLVYSDFLQDRKKTCYLFFIFKKSKSSFSLYAKTQDKSVIFRTFFNFTKVLD